MITKSWGYGNYVELADRNGETEFVERSHISSFELLNNDMAMVYINGGMKCICVDLQFGNNRQEIEHLVGKRLKLKNDATRRTA